MSIHLGELVYKSPMVNCYLRKQRALLKIHGV